VTFVGPVPGNSWRGSSSQAVIPAVVKTSTSTGAPNPSADGLVVAMPLISVATMLWLTFKITGIAGLPLLISPLPPVDEEPPDRNTVVRNVTGAAITGSAIDAESTTCTTIG